jgi:hypothetical protein
MLWSIVISQCGRASLGENLTEGTFVVLAMDSSPETYTFLLLFPSLPFARYHTLRPTLILRQLSLNVCLHGPGFHLILRHNGSLRDGQDG